MSFQATSFEFNKRFWFIAAIFAITFGLYKVDEVNVSIALTRKILGWGGHAVVDSPGFDNAVRVWFIFGTILLVLAALIRSWATAYLKSSIVHDSARHSEALVAEGPYRHVRNPLYLGNILQALGIGLMASRLGFAFLTVVNTVFMFRLILHEEAGLLQTQGESYRRYFAAVPRLLPSLRPLVPSGGATPNWRDGVTGEAFFWIFALGMAVFAITLNGIHFEIVLAIGFAIYFLQNYLRMGRIT